MIGRRGGLALFLFGAVLTFAGAWVAPWFTSPVWSSAPPEAFEGTAWAAFGPIFLALWFWAKNHRLLAGRLRAASIYQLISYVLIFLVALLLCTLLGNPFSGLYFPERVLAQNALPFHYSFGTKAAVYLELAMFFAFLSQRTRARAGG